MGIKHKRLIIAATIFVIIAGILTNVLTTNSKVFLETTTGRYAVVSARFTSGTNHTFAINTRWKMWSKRLLSPMGIHVAGRDVPNPPEWPGHKMHVISVRCEAKDAANTDARLAARNQELLHGMSGVEAECIDDAGRTIRLKNGDFRFGTEKIVWFIWHYNEPEIAVLHRWGLSDVEITNFCPRQLRLIRKSDHHELTHLDLEH